MSGLSTHSSIRRKPPPDTLSGIVLHPQNFWKFHVAVFGSAIYLTTNPSPRHLRCRFSPGYFVTKVGDAHNYSLIFEDLDSGDELLRVDRRADAFTHQYGCRLRKVRSIDSGKIRVSETPGFHTNLRLATVSLSDSRAVSYDTTFPDGSTWSIGNRLGERFQEKAGTNRDLLFYHGNEILSLFRPFRSHVARRVQHRLVPDQGRSENGMTVHLQAEDPRQVSYSRDDEAGHGPKYGWITVFDHAILGQPGVFDTVLALSVAVGYEQAELKPRTYSNTY